MLMALRVMMSHVSRVPNNAWRSEHIGTIAIWGAYVALVTVLARVAADRNGTHEDTQRLLHGFITSVEKAPPLARWDAIWYYGIAAEGYSDTAGEGRPTAGFLPLYPMLIRGIAALAGLDYFTAGLWISRASLLAVLVLLPLAADCRDGATPTSARRVQFALLSFPTAFLLVAVYTESLFLSLTLAAFALARREQHAFSAVAAFLASLTRVHGLALVPALAILALNNRRGNTRWGRVLAPPIAAASAYVGLAIYYWYRFDDPLRYLTAKREGWGVGLATPLQTLSRAVAQLDHSLHQLDLGTVLRALEIPCFWLILITAATCGFRGATAEAAYTVFGLALSLISGSLWGLPRFTLVLFPVFLLIAVLSRHRRIWYGYLAACALAQICLVVNYVSFGRPAP